MAELNVAIVGAGAIGEQHLSHWANLSGVRVAAISDSQGRSVARLAAMRSETAAFMDVADLLAAQPYDIVDICTPTNTHFRLASQALRAGANVICETPLAGSVEEAAGLVSLARERERLLMPAFRQRFYAPFQFARELVEADDLGRITMLRLRLSGLVEGRMEEDDEPEAGGAANRDNALTVTGAEGLDLFRCLCGEVVSITGRIRTVDPERSGIDTVACLLEAASGAIGIVEASWSQIGGRSGLEIYGTAGACLVDYETGDSQFLTADQPFYRTRSEGGPSATERMLAHFTDAVRGLQTLLVTGEDGVRAQQLCADVLRQNTH